MHDGIHLHEVSPSVVAVVDERFVSNAEAVIFSDFIVVVDAGKSAYAAHRLRDMLDEEYRRPVRYVVVTHYHVDHIAGLAAFSDVAIIGSTAVAARMRDLPEWTREEMRAAAQNDPVGSLEPGSEEPQTPTLVFDESVTITGDKSLELHHAGGHTSCSTWGYLVEDRVLLAGDLVVAGEFPFAGDETMDPEAWMSALRTWQGMDIERVVPGHGPVSGADVIGRQLEFLESLKANVLRTVQAGKGPDDVTVPDMVPVAEGREWFVPRTLARWHSYYTGVETVGQEGDDS